MILSMNFEIMIQDFKFKLKFYRKIMIQGKIVTRSLLPKTDLLIPFRFSSFAVG